MPGIEGTVGVLPVDEEESAFESRGAVVGRHFDGAWPGDDSGAGMHGHSPVVDGRLVNTCACTDSRARPLRPTQ